MTQIKTSVSHRVLLVDDDQGVRAMMRETLEAKEFSVVPAGNVTEALKVITTESFDVLITDLHMPNPVMVLRWLSFTTCCPRSDISTRRRGMGNKPGHHTLSGNGR